MPKSVLKSIQTCFEHVLGQSFRKFFAQFSMEGQVFETFQKNQKICKIPKMPKIVPKSIQTCFELVLGQIFRKNFLPSVPWRVESSKIFPKNQKILKIQKCPKSFPKVSKHVLNMFWGKLFEKFLPSFPWSVESSKIFKKNIFKIPKMPKSVPKCIQTCFRVIFSKKKLCPVFHGRSSFRKFSNFFFKIPKMPKIVPESIQTCFERVLGQIFRKIFLPSVPWMVEFSKIFKKMFSKFQKCLKVFPNVSKRVLG